MKKVLISITCLLVLTALYACSNVGNEDLSGDEGAQSTDIGTSQGITVNDISFERVAFEDLNEEIKDQVDKNKEDSGFEVLLNGQDSYLVVYAGVKPTAGYSIEITKIADNEGITQVTVKENAPDKGVMVAQVLTYPFDIVKLCSGISGNVVLDFVSNSK